MEDQVPVAHHRRPGTLQSLRRRLARMPSKIGSSSRGQVQALLLEPTTSGQSGSTVITLLKAFKMEEIYMKTVWNSKMRDMGCGTVGIATSKVKVSTPFKLR